jgi:hypothetical protein
MNRDEIEHQICSAFAEVEAPPAWALANSTEGEEPLLLAQEFEDKKDWRVLTSEFLDGAPGGLGSALSFFSDESLRFYLPAYLLADLRGELSRVDVAWHLSNCFRADMRNTRINAQRYGARTWYDEAVHRFSVFTRAQASAIVAYLTYKAARPEANPEIGEALRAYWSKRATLTPPN